MILESVLTYCRGKDPSVRPTFYTRNHYHDLGTTTRSSTQDCLGLSIKAMQAECTWLSGEQLNNHQISVVVKEPSVALCNDDRLLRRS